MEEWICNNPLFDFYTEDAGAFYRDFWAVVTGNTASPQGENGVPFGGEEVADWLAAFTDGQLAIVLRSLPRR